MFAKRGLLSRLFATKSDSDCCEVMIVADDEDTGQEARPNTDTTESCCAPDTASSSDAPAPEFRTDNPPAARHKN